MLINPLCCEIVGISQLSSAVGFYFTLAGIACILGGPLAGNDTDISEQKVLIQLNTFSLQLPEFKGN